jgi:PTH1 family peptidyl-tRNA hydrolase
MKYALVGLGNPGKKYYFTRHNAGFLILDEIREFWGFPEFALQKKCNTLLSQGEYDGKSLVLAKPLTFMNLSGESVSILLGYYNIPLENLIIIHDDKDFGIGEIRVTQDSSSAGHNGVQNIFDHLKTQHIKRIRIGIGPKPEEIPTDTYVLSRFNPEEQQNLFSLQEALIKEIETLLP